MEDQISVITASRNGINLERCVQSVAAQSYSRVEHVIVVDGNYDLLHKQDHLRSINACLHMHLVDDIDGSLFVNARVGALYNRGVELSSGDLVARVDDDNTVEQDHLQSLHSAIASNPGVDAAYSWRRIWNHDGTEFIEPRLPWHNHGDSSRGMMLYEIWEKAGIVSRGSNVYRDSLSTFAGELEITTVDASEWLWKRSAFRSIKYQERFEYFDVLYGASEDDLFSLRFRGEGLSATCTQLATLNYYLGGHSNNLRYFDRD